ncbi:hypothetical protein YC2023_079675 [Brassica napus]
MTSLLWLTAEEAAKNRGKVLSLYRQLLRSINSQKLQLSYASRLAKKAEIKTIFLFGSEEVSKHNVADLIRTGEYALSQLKQGKIPNNATHLNKQVITCNAQQAELGVNGSHYAITHVNDK